MSKQKLSSDNNEEPEMYVVDSEEYQKTKKLQSIYDAKKKFKEVWYNEKELLPEFKEVYRGKNGKEPYNSHLGDVLLVYVSELIPLIEDSLEAGLLDDNDLIVSLHNSEDNLIEMAEQSFSYVSKNDRERHPYSRMNLIRIFRHTERIERKLGLGLEIEEETQPAQI